MTDEQVRPRTRLLTSGRLGVALGVVALSLSLGVPSQAARLINGGSLTNNSVTSAKIKDNDLTGKDIKQDSLTGKDIKESTLKVDVAAYGNANSTAIDNFTTASFASLVSVSFDAPGKGFLFITGAISAEDDGSFAGGGHLLYLLRLDSTPLSGSFAHELDYQEVSSSGDSGAATGVVAVTKGSHTVSLDGREVGSGSFILGREVSVLFVPKGSGFTPPARLKAPDTSGSAQN